MILVAFIFGDSFIHFLNIVTNIGDMVPDIKKPFFAPNFLKVEISTPLIYSDKKNSHLYQDEIKCIFEI